jgi:two-component system, OmpR family, sensor histidine kinase KdpD
VAVERFRLVEDIDKARVSAESERLRAALLTSLSHDLKTPLASIIGASSALQQRDAHYDEAAQRDLAAMIQEEAERLSRFVHNLLDMMRLESGAIELKAEPVDLGELVGSALQRTTRLFERLHVDVELAPDLPMVRLDVVLFEQVLFNLLDNAAKYAPVGSTVSIHGHRLGDGAVLQVCDEGPGIPEEELESVFEKFYRVRGGDRRRVGTGLGLAVCRGFVEALGGTIQAGNRGDRPGAVFTIEFPASMIVEEPREPATATA